MNFPSVSSYVLLICFIVAMLTYCEISIAQDTISKRSVLYVGLWPKISTNGKDAEYYTNNLSMNLIFAHSTNERGLGINGLVTMIEKKASGVQISGLGLGVHKMSGISIAFFNSATIHNGLQISPFLNYSDSLSGIQFGCFNRTENLSGMQAGFYNNTDSLTDIQFGYINQSNTVSGLQIGIINLAEQNDYPIGLISIIKNGEKGVSLTFDEMRNFTVGFRSGGRVLFGIIGFGYSFIESTPRFVLECGLGARVNYSHRFRINTELAYSDISKIYGNETPQPEPPETKALTINRTSIRILPTFKIFNFNIFAGVSVNYMQSSHIENQNLFPHRYLWRNWTRDSLQQLSFGFMAGVQYCF